MEVSAMDKVQAARLLTLRCGLKLEVAGLTKRGLSCYGIVKKELGLKGSKLAVYNQLTVLLQQTGILSS